MKLRCRHVVNEHSPLHKVNASISLICLSQLSKEFILFSQKKSFSYLLEMFSCPKFEKNSYISGGNFKVPSLIKIKHLNQFFKVNFHLN